MSAAGKLIWQAILCQGIFRHNTFPRWYCFVSSNCYFTDGLILAVVLLYWRVYFLSGYSCLLFILSIINIILQLIYAKMALQNVKQGISNFTVSVNWWYSSWFIKVKPRCFDIYGGMLILYITAVWLLLIYRSWGYVAVLDINLKLILNKNLRNLVLP